jgi:hypothetical protein
MNLMRRDGCEQPLPEIWLTWTTAELRLADRVGHERRRQAVLKNRKSGREDDAAKLAGDLMGARAELAAKYYLDPITWHDLADDLEKLCDLEIGTGLSNLKIDVKGTDRANGSLIVKENKSPLWAYLLVYMKNPMEYRILGYLWGSEVQLQPLWRDDVPEPAYFAPQGLLRPAATLLGHVCDRR